MRRTASSLSPTTHLASSQESAVRGRSTSPRTSGQSRLGPREFGEDASYSPSLHHHRYVNCVIGAACTASGGMAHAAQPVLLAHAHNSTRLRDSVRQATSQVQQRSRDFSGSPVLCKEIAVLLAKDAIEPVPPAEMRLHHTQERWGLPTNLGSASLETCFAQAPVQDADAQTHYQMHPATGLVCSDRPEGRLLSCFDPSATQTIPTVCVQGLGMAVLGPPPRALPVSPCLYEEGALIPLREVGVRSPTTSTIGLSWPNPESSCVITENLCISTSASWGFGSTEKRVSEAPGAYGIRSCSHAARVASYETTSALATLPSPEVGMVLWYTSSKHHSAVSPLPHPLDGPCFSTGHGAPRTSVPAYYCHNRCLQHGLGRCMQWAGFGTSTA